MKPALQLRPAGPEVAALAHAHRWRIEEPRGPTSPGRCRDCGAVRIFRNSASGDDFIANEQNRSTGREPPGLRFPASEPAEADAVLV